LPSKYENAWRKIFDKHGGVEFLLKHVRSGEEVRISVDDLKEYGERVNWYGKVVLSKDGIVGSMSGAHVNALRYILPMYIHPEEKIECKVTEKDSQLILSMRLFPSFIRRRGRKKNKETRETPPSFEPLSDPKVLGDFYILVSSFERDLRNFIKEKLGKGYLKRLSNEGLRKVVDDWRKRQQTDEYWGIKAEPELINYALLSDYMEIIKKYKRMFASNEEELNDVITHLKIFANQGRNPLMHCRTLTLQKYFATKAAIDFLRGWIEKSRIKSS